MQIVGGPRSPASREGLPPPAGFLYPRPPGELARFFRATSSPRHTQRGPRITRAPAKTPLEIYRRSFPLLNSLSRSAKKRGERGRARRRPRGRTRKGQEGEAGLEEKKLQRSPWKLHSGRRPLVSFPTRVVHPLALLFSLRRRYTAPALFRLACARTPTCV